MYYTLKQNCNRYFINDLEVTHETFNKIIPPKYKQVEYTCYFNKDNDFIREWIMTDDVEEL